LVTNGFQVLTRQISIRATGIPSADLQSGLRPYLPDILLRRKTTLDNSSCMTTFAVLAWYCHLKFIIPLVLP